MSDDEDICLSSNWTLGGGDIRWTYVIDLDNQVFTVNGLLHFKFDDLPPLRTSGSTIGFVDYFRKGRNDGALPKIPEKHLTSLEFWPRFIFDAEKAQQEYSTLQPTVVALSEWNAPTWDSLSVPQRLSTSLIKTLIADYSDELALYYYSPTWIKLGVFWWNVANAAATAHLLCPPANAPPNLDTSYILNIGLPALMPTSPHPTTEHYLEYNDIRNRYYRFRGCLFTFYIRLDGPTYVAHKVVQMVQRLRKNGRTQGVGIIISPWHLIAVTVDGTDLRHSPALELHDGKEPKDGVSLLMHLLSPTFTCSKAPWVVPLHTRPCSNSPIIPDEILRQIIRFTDFETYVRLSKVSRYFRSIYLAEPRIGNYTLFGYEGVSPNSETIFRVRGIDSTNSQLAILKRVKTSLDPSQKALLLHRYEWDFDLTNPILHPGLGGMFQYHKSGSKHSDRVATEETQDASTRVGLKPMSFARIVRGKKSVSMRVQALDGIWEMVGVDS